MARRIVGLSAAAAVCFMLVACKELDPSFGEDGKVTTQFGPLGDAAGGVALDANGRIVVAGCTVVETPSGFQSDFAVARYLPDGTLDTSFDGDGKVTTDLGGRDCGTGVAVGASGRIVVAGVKFDFTTGTSTDFAVARYLPDGSLDPSFGDDGSVVTNVGDNDVAHGVAVGSGGNIIVAGERRDSSEFDHNDDVAVVRYLPDGSLDPAFSGDGIAITDFGGPSDTGHAVAIGPSGKIVVAGSEGDAGPGIFQFAAVRYLLNGSLDTSFGGDGIVTTNITQDASQGEAVAVDAAGRVVVAGQTPTEPAQVNHDIAVVRYLANGSLDTSFGDGGVALTGVGADDDAARAVAIDSAGKIVVTGRGINQRNGDDDIAVVRYLSNGTLDTTFSQDGKALTGFKAGADDDGGGIVIEPDDDIVVAGMAGAVTGDDRAFGVARYLATTPTD